MSTTREVMIANVFINLLTGDTEIRIGYDLESVTLDVNTSRYVDTEANVGVTLVDTPGFDDSREGVTDIDILGKITNFLQADGGRRLSGIIYLHRISDPRMGGAAKKNLKVFRELCGDENFANVRIVTTYWGIVDEKEGNSREAALARGPFNALKMVRHDKGLESARSIMSGLVQQTAVTLKMQKELDAGKSLGDTSAGGVILEEMKEMQKKQAKEMEELNKEMEAAATADNDDLKAESAEERRKLEEAMLRMEKDQKRLEVMQIASETQPVERKAKEGSTKMVRTFELDVAQPVSRESNTGISPQHQIAKSNEIKSVGVNDPAGRREPHQTHHQQEFGEGTQFRYSRLSERLPESLSEDSTDGREVRQECPPSEAEENEVGWETQDVIKQAVDRAVQEERQNTRARKALDLNVPTICKPALVMGGFFLDGVENITESSISN